MPKYGDGFDGYEHALSERRDSSLPAVADSVGALTVGGLLVSSLMSHPVTLLGSVALGAGGLMAAAGGVGLVVLGARAVRSFIAESPAVNENSISHSSGLIANRLQANAGRGEQVTPVNQEVIHNATSSHQQTGGHNVQHAQYAAVEQQLRLRR